MAPPSLTFKRELRYSTDVVIRFAPRTTEVEITHQKGRLFILSDLFLICESMSNEERSQRDDGADMWLCYPPLAGKVLRATEIPEQRTVVLIDELLTLS